MKEGVSVFLKGVAMGAANVIPGVSGGTVAFITGIYERLIHAVKSFDREALALLLKRDFAGFAKRTDFRFLAVLGTGVILSILTLASLLEFLYERYEVLVWAFFFGLIFSSVYFVGKQVGKWSPGPIAGFVFGAAVAVAMAFLKPAEESDDIWYLFLCGIVAMASMIIPGLSGSFVLILMGNYQLVMVESVAALARLDLSALRVLLPVGIGAVLGVAMLSRLLAWIFRVYHDLAVALLTGFVAGSLLIVWPWKEKVLAVFVAAGESKEKVVGYHWFLPDFSGETILAVIIALLGFLAVWWMEKAGGHLPEDGEKSPLDEE